jgi:hypothetical protein
MEELKKIKKTEVDKMVKIRIQISGFPNQRAGSKFFEQIIRPEYKRLFEGSNLRMEQDGVMVYDEYLCCKTTERETEWFVGSETMAYCILVGTGCPV